jgi:hypothetical protein
MREQGRDHWATFQSSKHDTTTKQLLEFCRQLLAYERDQRTASR